jgi:hypothetical protein
MDIIINDDMLLLIFYFDVFIVWLAVVTMNRHLMKLTQNKFFSKNKKYCEKNIPNFLFAKM